VEKKNESAIIARKPQSVKKKERKELFTPITPEEAVCRTPRERQKVLKEGGKKKKKKKSGDLHKSAEEALRRREIKVKSRRKKGRENEPPNPAGQKKKLCARQK